MKYSNLRAFKKHLQEAGPDHFAPVYLVVSKEDYERKEALSAIVEAIIGTPNDYNYQAFDQQLDRLIDELNSMGIFADKRVVVAHVKEKPPKQLESYFANPSPSVYLVVVAEAINRGTKFYKEGEKVGVVLDILEEKAWEKEASLATKIAERITAMGKRIDASVCKLLVQQLGTNQMQLFNEVEKLVCYVGEREEITAHDVQAICSTVPTETIWQLGDAIFELNGAAALRVVHGLLAQETPIFMLLRQIRSQVQTKLQICSLTPPEVQQQFPYMKGRILQRNMELAQKYGVERCKRALIQIDQTEMQAKNSQLSHELLADMLIGKLTT